MKFKTILFFSLCLSLAFCQGLAAKTRQSINSGWNFSMPNKEGFKPQIVNIPHTWNAEDATDDVPGFYRGLGVYEKSLKLGPEVQGKEVTLFFEGANQDVNVYVNGNLAGNHKGGYTAFNIDITPYIKTDAINDIKIEVDNSHNPDIPPLSADFTFFGGIYRDVFLEVNDPIHISNTHFASSGLFITTPEVNKDEAQVEIELMVDNKLDKASNIGYRHEIFAPNGELAKTIEGKRKLSANTDDQSIIEKFVISSPELWSPNAPQLYRLQTTIYDLKTKEPLQTKNENFGLRWFSFDPYTGFELNGEPMKLIGANRHQDYPGKGYANDDACQIRDIQLVKDMGGNYLRVAHYPQDPLVLKQCDKLGLLASVETPIVNAVTESEEFLQNSLIAQEEMIKQNYNHPSVIVWAYMNEVMLVPPYKGNDERFMPYCQEVHRQAQAIEDLTRKLDPYRYTLIPFHNGMGEYEAAKLFDVPMIIGWNLYHGWYSGNCDGLEGFLDHYHKKYPNKPTIMTEYGADCDTRLHSFDPLRFDYTIEYSDIYHEHYLNAIKNLDYLAGANIWNLVEFHSENRGNAKPHFNLKGVVTRDRKPKNGYWLYKANLSDEPFVAFGADNWTTRSGVLTEEGICINPIKIYTNSDSVTLYHNKTLVGKFPVKEGNCVVSVPMVDGMNTLHAVTPEADNTLIIDFKGIPQSLATADFTELSVLPGSNRFFFDEEKNICWIPSPEYQEGSWGVIGGTPLRCRTWSGNLPASDIDVLGTDLDPLYQTALLGIEGFKADVLPGTYAIYLHWADLTKEEYQDLAYNLHANVQHEESDNAFDVIINGKKVLENLDVRQEVGRQRPLDIRIDLEITDDKGIDIQFVPVKGQTSLHALRIVKL